MAREALAELAADGYPPERTRLQWAADLRYVGQGFELLVPMEIDNVGPATLARLEAAFNEEHERTYGHRSEGAPVQFVNLRLTARGLRDGGSRGSRRGGCALLARLHRRRDARPPPRPPGVL